MSQTITSANFKQNASSSIATRCLTFNHFDLWLPEYKFFVRDQQTDIDPKILTLLVLLIDARPKLVTKDDLMDVLWPDSEVTDWSLSRLISDARKVLEDDGKEQQIIKTIRGKGYSFVADVDERINLPLPNNQHNRIKQPAQTDKRKTLFRFSDVFTIRNLIIFAVVCFLIALVLWALSGNKVAKPAVQVQNEIHTTLAHKYEVMLSLQKNLALTKTVFIAQARRRNELGEMFLDKRPDLLPLSWEQRFRIYFPELTDDEKFIFDQIKSMTAGSLYKGNTAILATLLEHPEMYQEIPILVDLYSHLELWVNKHTNVFQKREDMPLVYVGVEDGVPFPSQIDQLVADWISAHQSQL